MQYYYGQPYGNEVEGRSQVVTTEVLDAIEGILPSLIDMFVSSDEAVRCDPTSPETEQIAKDATDYLNHVFYKDNQGFLNLYCLFKDALLQKNGFSKVYWEDYQDVEKETYEGLSDDEFTFLMQDDELELIEHSSDGLTHDAVFKRTKKYGKTCVVPVPPEEALVSRDTPNDIKKARFVEHKCKKSISELRGMGFTVPDDIADDHSGEWNVERVERNKFDDDTVKNEVGIGAAREVWVKEAYLRVDQDKDGIAELWKITVVGKTILDKEEVDNIPFITGTPILMPHKLYGLSISDLVMSIQEIKSTITRQLLDNSYLANNGRYEALDGMVNMDDLLTNRPGGIVRVKTMGAVARIDTPLLGAPTFNLLEYFDQVKNSRVGVSPTQFAGDPNALNAKAHVAEIARDSAMQRIELIGRILAETAVKPLFEAILELECKHQDRPKQVKARTGWITVDPRQWKDKITMTITVGLGTGSQQTVLNGAMGILQIQQGMAATGLSGRVVTEQNAYHAGMAYAKAVFPKLATQFFTDPSTLPTAQPQIDPKIQLAAQKAQMQDQQKKDALGMQYQIHTEDLQHEAGMQAADVAGQASLKGIDVASQTNLSNMQHIQASQQASNQHLHEARTAAAGQVHEHAQNRMSSQEQERQIRQQLEAEHAQAEKERKAQEDQKKKDEQDAMDKKAMEEKIASISDEKDQKIEKLQEENQKAIKAMNEMMQSLHEKVTAKRKRTVKVVRDQAGNLIGADIEE
jgi:hypothetical protein